MRLGKAVRRQPYPAMPGMQVSPARPHPPASCSRPSGVPLSPGPTGPIVTHKTELKRRTLTNRYNARPARLDLTHRRLDDAVLDAYGHMNSWFTHG